MREMFSNISLGASALSHSVVWFFHPSSRAPFIVPYGGSVSTKSTPPSGMSFISSKQSPCHSVMPLVLYSPPLILPYLQRPAPTPCRFNAAELPTQKGDRLAAPLYL